MNNNNLIIPIYLNQKIVFDLLAIYEDGFSQIKNYQNTTNEDKNSSNSFQGELGVKNIFAFLGVNLKGEHTGGSSKGVNETISEEKVHTPTSLFSKLLDYLSKDSKIKNISTPNDLSNITTGDFLTFKGTLEKNPLLNALESIQKIIELVALFDTDERNNHSSKKNKFNNQSPMVAIAKQIEGLKDSLDVGGMTDIICQIDGQNEIKAVLQAQYDFFYNRSMNELTDGEYTVLGKAVKIINSPTDGKINLLRNTSLRMAKSSLLEKLTSGFSSQDISDAGIEMPKIVTSIDNNGVLVIPIAIYT